MDVTFLQSCSLFRGLSGTEIEAALEKTPHFVHTYEKDQTVFAAMEDADRIGIVLTGRLQAHKLFPSGSQVNVSVRMPGDMVGPAAAFSRSRRYPCEVVALESTRVLLFFRNHLLLMLQNDTRITENFLSELATTTYMLQQRLEILSYNGIAQKAACYLMMQYRQTGKAQISIPESMTRWAMMLNVSRSSLHRELGKLEEQGLLRYAPPVIEILKPAALVKVLE